MMRRGDLIFVAVLVGLAGSAAFAAFWPLQEPDMVDGVRPDPERHPERAADWSGALAARLSPRPRTVPETPTAVRPLDGFSLIGVVEADAGGWALVSRRGQLTTLPVGGSLDGYELISLTPASAIFERESDRIVLTRQ